MIKFIKRFCTVSSKIHNDITVVGNGSVGNSLLLSLKEKNLLNKLKITMIGRKKEEFDISQYNYQKTKSRIFTLTLSSQKFFENIKIWPLISEFRDTMKKIKVFDSYGATLVFKDKIPLGYTVDERVLNLYLDQSLKDCNYQFIDQDIIKIEQDKDLVFIYLKDGTIIQTKLLISCDGANSKVALLLNSNPFYFDYQMKALSMTVQTNCDEEFTAFQKFSKEGIIAFLPLGQGAYSLIWSGKSGTISRFEKDPNDILIYKLNDIINSRQSSIFHSTLNPLNRIMYVLKPGFFSGELSENFKIMIKEIVPESKVCYPLYLRMMKSFTDGRVFFCGDAAHKVLPISGHGFNLGIGDVQLLSDHIANDCNLDSLCTSKLFYNLKRQSKAAEIAQLTTLLKVLYLDNSLILDMVASPALSILNKSDTLKKLMMNAARY